MEDSTFPTIIAYLFCLSAISRVCCGLLTKEEASATRSEEIATTSYSETWCTLPCKVYVQEE